MSAYVEKALARLGSRDPIQVQESLLPGIEALLRGLPPALLSRPEKPGKWSIAQTVQHLADAELAFGWRLRIVLSQSEPVLQNFDEDLWARELRYEIARFEEAWDPLRALRTANLRLWKRTSPVQFERVGRHQERGPESLGLMLKLYASHDLAHLAQIDRIKASFAAGAHA